MVVKKRSRFTRSRKSSGMRSKTKKVRLAIQCSPRERKFMKIYAAHEDQTLNEFVMESVRMRMSECVHSHEPNRETRAALDATERGEDLIAYKSLEDFFKSLEK